MLFRSCEGGAQKEATDVGQRHDRTRRARARIAATVTRGAVRCSAWLGHGSFEWSDWQKRKLLPRTIPVVAEFLEVNRTPSVDEVMGGFRKVALVDGSGLDLNQGFVLSIYCVEMSWRVVAVVKPNDDAVKTADLRHGVVRLPGDRKSTRLNSSHERLSRMPSSA